jgi:hypothetical protein
MKRAAVWREPQGRWWACVYPAEQHQPALAIHMRGPRGPQHEHERFRTHAAALAHALAEVGLTEKNTEKGQNR